MGSRVFVALLCIFFSITTVFLVIYKNVSRNGFNILCNISHLDTDVDFPITISWAVHRDQLYGQNSAIYSARICDRQHCIDRTTVLTIVADGITNDTRQVLVCPVMSEEKTTFRNWHRMELLDQKRAIILKVGDEVWPETTNIFLFDNLMTNGTTHVCVWEHVKIIYNLTAGLANFHDVSGKTRDILLICTAVLMALAALACIAALSLCLWRRCCPRQEFVFTSEAWINRVTVTWPVPDPSVPALAYQMRVPNVEVERFRIIARRNLDESIVQEESFQLPYDPKWELEPSTSIQLGNVLGIGPYGKILVAKVHSRTSGAQTVAVKMLKQSFKPAELKSLICELEIMKMLDHHENVINLIGCYTTKCAPMLFMEYAELGNLQAFLKSATNVPELTYGRQISIAWQIAKGMQFLAENKCVHRSLASRNVLLTGELIVKISNHASYQDLSNSEFLDQMTSRNVMSMRWLAPESISDHIFDFKSDIWAFGIVLWEIMTYGSTPYPKLGGDRTELQKAICNGYQMEQPENCTNQIYKVMESCWSFHPFNRPTFKILVETTNKFLSANSVDGLQRSKPNDAHNFSRSSSVYYNEQPPDDDLKDVDGRRADKVNFDY